MEARLKEEATESSSGKRDIGGAAVEVGIGGVVVRRAVDAQPPPRQRQVWRTGEGCLRDRVVPRKQEVRRA